MRYVLVVLLLGLAGLAFAGYTGGATERRPFSEIASSIAKRDVEVRCPTLFRRLIDVAGETGKVEFDERGRPESRADLSGEACSSLDDFPGLASSGKLDCVVTGEECPKDARKAVVAVHTLAHESYHLAGWQDEATAECYALQTDGYVAQQLGASPRLAQAIVRYYLEEIYPLQPGEYQSSQCRDRGRLDLRPATPGWP
jgi:hypothetical protein